MSSILPIAWKDKKNSPLLADYIAKHGAEYLMTAEEINQLRDAVNEMSVIQQSTFLGVAEPAFTPAGTGRAYWIAIKPGTYANHGNVIVGVNEIAFIIRDVAGAFSISKTPIDLANYAQKGGIAEKGNQFSTDGNEVFNATRELFVRGVDARFDLIKDLKIFNADLKKSYYIKYFFKETGYDRWSFQVNDSSDVTVCDIYVSPLPSLSGVQTYQLGQISGSGVTGMVVIDWGVSPSDLSSLSFTLVTGGIKRQSLFGSVEYNNYIKSIVSPEIAAVSLNSSSNASLIADSIFVNNEPMLSGIIDAKIVYNANYSKYAIQYFQRAIDNYFIRLAGWNGAAWVIIGDWNAGAYVPTDKIEVIQIAYSELTINWDLVPMNNNFIGNAEIKKSKLLPKIESINILYNYDVFESTALIGLRGITYARISGGNKDKVYFIQSIEKNTSYRRIYIDQCDFDGTNSSRIATWLAFNTDFVDEQRVSIQTGVGVTIELLLNWVNIQGLTGSYVNANFLKSVYYNVDSGVILNSGYELKDNINKIVTVDGFGNGDFLTIESAYNSIGSMSNINNQYEIVVFPGTYNEVNLKPPAFSHTHGLTPNSVVVTSKGKGGTFPVFDQQYTSSKLSNMKIISDTGYCVHFDIGLDSQVLTNENLHLVKISNGAIIGGGSFRFGTVYNWLSCIFENGYAACHTNVNALYENIHLNFRNCKMINAYITVGSVGGFGHCVLDVTGLVTIAGQTSVTNWISPLRNLDLPNIYFQNNFEWQVIGGNNTNLLIDITSNGEGLMFETPNVNESIELSGNSVTLLFGNVNYQKGGARVKGGARGAYMVKDTQAGQMPYTSLTDVYQMWKRLGDCSVNNKTLSVTKGAVTQSFIFSDNYLTTKESESSIISKINAVITIAVLKKYSGNYTWNNININETSFVIVSDSNDILKNEFVTSDGLKCSENASINDVYGVALFDGVVGDNLKIYTGNIVRYSIGDGEVGIGNDGKLSLSATTKIGNVKSNIFYRF